MESHVDTFCDIGVNNLHGGAPLHPSRLTYSEEAAPDIVGRDPSSPHFAAKGQESAGLTWQQTVLLPLLIAPVLLWLELCSFNQFHIHHGFVKPPVFLEYTNPRQTVIETTARESIQLLC